MEFKDILKSERIAHGYTQEELGRLVGLKKSAIHKYENGLVVNPGRSLIFKFAKALDVSPAYLLGIEDERPTDSEKDLLECFRTLNSDGKEKVLAYAHDLVGLPQYLEKSVISVS
jgi:transcriptional regulator with XRE-family HTH domain